MRQDEPSAEAMRQRLEELWARGQHREAIEMGERLTRQFPSDPAWHETLAVLRVHYAREAPPEDDQLGPALRSLERALELDPERISSLEIMANLQVLLGHQLEKGLVFSQALRNFLKLEQLAPAAGEEVLSKWRVEAARAAFLAARHSGDVRPDYELALNLYSRLDGERHEPTDWFFRGLAALETARQKRDDQQLHRQAAACFLRTLETGEFTLEATYFAADALVSLEDPTGHEFQHAVELVQKLLDSPSRDFLVTSLRKRLELRANLLGRELPPLEEE